MARRLSALAFGAVVVGSAATAAGADPIDGYRWKSRVLVLAAANAADPMLRAQRKALAAARPGASERDLVTIEAVGGDSRASALRRRFGLPDDGFRAVLIGKDGGAKLTSDRPIAPEALFSTIDAMPMRRGEMKR